MPMTDSTRARIRQFVMEFFNDEELNTLSFDYFPFVYNEFTTGMPKSQKVRLLIEGCERRRKIPDLLAALKRERPNSYDDYFAVESIQSQPESKPIQRNQRQIFISYAHQDTEFAQRLANDLRTHDWEIWIAPDSIQPGEKWVEAINRGLAESGVFVLVLTETAVNSRWVQSETNAAINMEHRGALRFLPIAVESTKAPPLWKLYQWVSFQSGYDSGLDTLLQKLESAETTPTTQSTIEQTQQKESESMLSDSPIAVQKSKESIREQLKRQLTNRPSIIWQGVSVALIVVLLLVTFWPKREPEETNTPQETVMAIVDNTPGSTANPTITATMKIDSSSTATKVPTPTFTPTATPTIFPTSLPLPEGKLGESWTRQIDGMTMVFVPGGTFKMGSDPEQDSNARTVEFPQRDVTLDSFWIDRTEVTNEMYAQCVVAGICNQAEYVTDPALNGADHPVVGVSWHDGDDYCQWIGGHLPTEAQWEYAGRGDDGRLYPWGDETPSCELVQFGNCVGDTAPVGKYSPAGDSWVGAADMAGNVWEWVADWYDELYYEYGPSANPIGPEDGIFKTARGGSWLNADRKFLRVATRADARPTQGNSSTGFRCAISSGN
jgi:formylglycine-generating enzyme required for sulfatase activity